MTGVLWAVVAGIGFGFFQSFNRRAGRSFDAYIATFLLLLISAVILAIASVATEDLTLLQTAPLVALVNFGLAGFIHFFIGWTFLTISQNRIGAARTGALVGATPLFATIVAVLAFGEFLRLPVLLGVATVVIGVYLVSNSGKKESKAVSTTWRDSMYGLGTAVCFAISPIFIRGGLEDLPSPLLGVTVGMGVSLIAYGIVLLLFQRGRVRQGPVSRDAMFFQIMAGIFVGVSTWVRWIALDTAPVAVVLALGRLNVPVVILLSLLLVGQTQERVTARIWLGATFIVAGSLVLIFFR